MQIYETSTYTTFLLNMSYQLVYVDESGCDKKGIKCLIRKPMNGQIHFVDRMHQLSCLSGHLSEILKCVFIHFLTTFFFF